MSIQISYGMTTNMLTLTGAVAVADTPAGTPLVVDEGPVVGATGSLGVAGDVAGQAPAASPINWK